MIKGYVFCGLAKPEIQVHMFIYRMSTREIDVLTGVPGTRKIVSDRLSNARKLDVKRPRVLILRAPSTAIQIWIGLTCKQAR